MPSFGEKLRLEREKRKITLDQISSSTKIGTRMLQALEEDRFSQLPGGIFNKGFVRAYARAVGLDEDQAVADYLEASGDAPPIRPELVDPQHAFDGAQEHPLRIREREEISDHHEISTEAPPRQLPWGVFAVVLLIVAVALSLWNHRRREQEQSLRQFHKTTAVQPSPAPPAEQGGLTGNASASNNSNVPPSSTRAKENQGTAHTSPVASSQKPPRSVQSSPAAAAQSSQATAPTPSPGEFTVVIQAHEESWLSMMADGKSIGSASLEAGDERTIHGRKEVVVKAGNVGGVSFFLNGKKLDISGESGEVKIITIGPAGVLPNAPAAPASQPAPQP